MKSHLRPIKLVVMVPAQVKQEPQLLHGHTVQDKTQTLNIVENATHKHSSKKTRPTHDQYLHWRSNELEDSIAHENNITDYNHYNQSEGSYSFLELQHLTSTSRVKMP